MSEVTPQTQQTTAPVAPVTEAPEAPKVTDEQISPHFAALARKQKAIRRMELDLKAREDAIKAKESEYEKNYIPKSKLKADPYTALTEEGISYDEVVNAAISQDPQSRALKMLEKKLQDLEAKWGSKEQELASQTQKQYEQAVNNIRNEVVTLVDKDTNYEAIKANKAEESVVALIEETYKEKGFVMSVEDAAKQVEDYLVEEAMKMVSLEKVKQRLNPPAPPAPDALKKPQSQIKTLTNAATAVSSKPLTNAEKRARAIAAFKGQPVI